MVDRTGNLYDRAVSFYDRDAVVIVIDRNELVPRGRSLLVFETALKNLDRILPLDEKADEREDVENEERAGDDQIAKLLARKKCDQHREKKYE